MFQDIDDKEINQMLEFADMKNGGGDVDLEDFFLIMKSGGHLF